MTKLEEKLIELGYEYEFINICDQIVYCKEEEKCIILDFGGDKIIEAYIRVEYFNIECQKDINELQQAFNEMQQDLAILKGCEQ